MKQDNRDNSRNWQTTNTGGTNYTGEIHFHGQEPNSPLTRQEYRNRQALLTKVKNFWVKGVLEKSLYNQVLIELGLEERFDAVDSSWNLEIETAGEAQKPLPKGTKVISIFDQLGEGRTLLILGEPGAGKTTTLLELARDLVNRAAQSLDYRIPVVLNLSSWAGKKQPIADWLVEELNSKYQVPKPIGQDWVKKQELLLLLDGLDEVKAEYRDSCVAALNDFQQNYASEMVVCSRIEDYEKLSNRLTFQSAIYLRALTLEQVCHYLDNIKADLTGLRALIKGDTVLQELAKSPLMLSIMVLAYEGVAVKELPNIEVVKDRRKQLFDAYIERIFRRRTRFKVEQRYSDAQSIRWLTWLAQRMVQESQTIFLIERMHPKWLRNKNQKNLYQLGILILSVVVLELPWVMYYSLISSMIFNLVVCIICLVIWRYNITKNNLLGFKLWSKKEVINRLSTWPANILVKQLIAGLISGLFFGLIFPDFKFGIRWTWVIGGIWWLNKEIPKGNIGGIWWLIKAMLKEIILGIWWLIKEMLKEIIFNFILTSGNARFEWFIREIKTVETLRWSLKEASKKLLSKLSFDLSLFLLLGISLGLLCPIPIIGILHLETIIRLKEFALLIEQIERIENPIVSVISYLTMGGIGGLIFGGILYLTIGITWNLIDGLIGGFRVSEIEVKRIPNEGIYRTAMNAGITGLICWFVGLICHLIILRILGVTYELTYQDIYGLVIHGLIFGTYGLFVVGGIACIQHFTLRVVCYCNNYIPWNYARFLDYATERIFLQKVGGGYIFIHRLLLEHFAQMELER